MILLLSQDGDLAASWLHAQIGLRTDDPVVHLRSSDLLLADAFTHRISDEGSSLLIRTHQLGLLDSREFSAVVNRLVTPPMLAWRSAPERDRSYAEQEIVAAWLSALACLPCQTWNRPSPRGLCGAWRSILEQRTLAAQCGLSPSPFHASSAAAAEHRPHVDLAQVIVVGEEAISARPLTAVRAAACVALARAWEVGLLGLTFEAGQTSDWQFLEATPLPDIRLGEHTLVDSLVGQLLARRSAS